MKLQTFLLAALVLNSGIAARAATLPAAEDSFSVHGKLTVATNTATTLRVDATHHGFIYFNLADSPAMLASQVRSARLRLYFPKVTKSGGGIEIHLVTGSWDETETGLEPTFDGNVAAAFAADVLGGKRFASVDVTAAVQGWTANPVSNEGFAIAAVPGTNVLIGAKEGTGSGYPAELEIERADDPIPPGTISGDLLVPNITLSGTTSGMFSGDGSLLTNLAAANLSGQITNNQIAVGLDAVKLGDGSVENSEFAQLNGVSAPIQSQLDTVTANANGKVSKAGDTMTGALTVPQVDVNGPLSVSGALRVPGAGNNTCGAAFIHVTTAGNVVSQIHNPLCDGDSSAILIVTHNGGVVHDHVVGVGYDGGHWYVFNEDSAFMPAGTRFNILVIKP